MRNGINRALLAVAVFPLLVTACSTQDKSIPTDEKSNELVSSIQTTTLISSFSTPEAEAEKNMSSTEDSKYDVVKENTYTFSGESFDLTLERGESREQNLVMHYNVGNCDSDTGYMRISAIHGQLETICDNYIIPCTIFVDGRINDIHILVATDVREDGIFTTGTEKDGVVSDDKLQHGGGYPDWYEFDVQNSESVEDFDELSLFLTKSLDSFCGVNKAHKDVDSSDATE